MLVIFRGKHLSIYDVENPKDFWLRNHTWRKQSSSVLRRKYRWKYLCVIIN